MAVLGGFSNFFGPIVGALTFTLLQDQLQSLTEYWRFVLGAILALIVIGFPEGIAGLAAGLGRRIGWRTACSLRPFRLSWRHAPALCWLITAFGATHQQRDAGPAEWAIRSNQLPSGELFRRHEGMGWPAS